MVASVLKRGNVAIVSYATDPIGADGDDIIRFVILSAIGSGTQIFFSDRNWNGTAFPVASAGEGTFTYTAGADLPAGTVITITSAQLLAAGMDLSNNGDTIYVYQGTNADTPTTFLFAIDVGDGNSVFEAGELTGTGLTAGVDAVAVGHDQASYSGPSTQIPQTQLTAISNTNQWHGHSGDDIGGTIYDDRADTSLSGPLNNPDMQLFVVNNGGGQSDAIVRIDNDEAANIGTNLTRLFRDNPAFTRLEDITFDIEDGVWFAADNEGTDVTRIVKGNIADLFNGNPNPTITVVFDYVNNGADPNDDKFIQGIEIDTVANRIFFGLGEISFGHELRSVDYNGGNSRNWGLIDLVIDPTFGFAGGIEDFVVDTANNTAYFSYVLVDAGAGQVLQNYVVRLTAPLNAAAPNPGVENYAIVNITNAGAPPAGYAAGRIPDAEGSIRGMDYHAATNTLWFVTGRLGAGGTAGIFTLNLTTGVYTEIWQQPSNNAHNTPQSFPTTLLVDIEVDSIGGRYYVTSLNSTDTPIGHDGTATDENGSRVWSGSLTDPIGTAPTFFASLFENTANGAGAGMEIDYAPTLTVGSAGSTYTESTNLPGSPAGPTVDVATSPVVNDVDQAIIQGATVAISTGFVSGDQLTFTNSGGITGTYNATTGVVTFTGNASFAAYQTVLDSVRFTNAGDNPTDYGASTSRIISFTVFDGLINSDPATATVIVVGINDAPVNTIQGAALGISEDALNVVLSTTGNAISVFDVDANPATQDIRVTLSVTQGTLTILTNVVGGIVAGDITAGANGTATITITATQNQINATLAATNGLLYNPIADYNGSDTLTIVTNDLGLNGNDPGISGTGTSEQDSDTRTINIAAVVDIANDTVNIAEDAGAQNLTLLANDSFENPGRAITAVGTALHGTVTINNNGTPGDATDDFVVYTATADYYGPDSFTYTVTSGGVTEQATVTVNISAVQDIADDTIPLNEDAGASQLDLLANDNFENAGRAITAVGTALHGTVTINNNGTAGDATDDYVVYTPTSDYNGSDSFTYTVTSAGVTEQATATINIAAVADIADDNVTVAEDSGVNSLNGIGNISLLANDSFENAGRFISAVTQGVNGGTVAIHNNGTAGDPTDDYVTYTPALNYNGPDSFTYTVTSGGVTETATANVTVTAVNDAPVNVVPVTQTINEDASVTFSAGNGNAISVSDVDVGAGNLTVTLSIADGTLTLSGTTNLVVSGNASNLVTLTGTAADINTALNGLVYAPPANANGSRTLSVTTNDNGNTGSDPGGDPGSEQDVDAVTINLTAINDTPVVTAAASGSSTEQVAGTVDATATISDIDLDALNGGNGNYAGASLNIANNGGNDANDLFAIGTSGAFTVNGGNLEAGGLVFATFSGGNGTPLAISFTSSGTAATTALVNAVVQSIQYTYTGDNPPVAGIDVAISLNDGAPANAGQGSIAGHPAVGTDIIHLSITNTPENQPPVVDLNGTDGGNDFASAYTEDGTAAVIADTDVSITDPDVGDDITGATITITDAIAGDQLTVLGALPGTIIATGGGTATITLSGTGTQAEYQQALTQIRYSSTSNDPTVGGTDLTRSVTVTVTDGDDPSGAATTIVTVTGTNDAPAGTDNTITVDEDGSIALNAANFDFTDPDSGDVMSAVIITSVTGGKLFFDADGAGGADPVEVTVFPTAEYSVADMAAGKLTFEPNANLNGSGAGSIGFQVVDNSGAVNDTDPSANTLTVNVTPINDQPNIPNSPTVTTDEQVAVTLNAAITVSDVDLDARNGGNGDYSGAAFAINRSVSNAEDVFSFDTAGAQFTVNGSNLESGGNVIATLAQAGGILNINFVNNGTVPTTALVNDVLQHLQYTNTSNEPPASVTLLYIIDDGAPASGGQGALGAPFNNLDGGQITVNIDSINDAPAGADKTITIDEDVGQVLTTADFGFTDTDNDAFESAVVVSVTGGTLLVDDGNIVTPPVSLTSGTISAADIAAGYVSFQPTAHLNGSGAGAISFQVVDNGGTDNGGQNTDQSANTITFDIDSVNDAPSGADNTVTGSEDDPYVFTAADFGFTDTADSNAFLAVRIMTFPANGTLFLDSDGPGGGAPVDLSTVGAGVYVSITDINAGELYFLPDPDEFGDGYANFTFAVQDDGGITNGGQDTDQSPNTMTIDIAPDNLPPAVDLDGGTGGVNYTASYTEDAPGVAIGSGVTVTDPNSGTGDMIESATITLTDRVAGDTLTLTGALPPGIIAVTTPSAGAITIQITGAGTGAQYQALIESILYATTSQDPTVGGTDAARTITVTVNDGLVDSAVATTTVNITALDDAAEAEADAYTITEQGSIVAGNLFADNGAGVDSDPDGPPLAVSAVNGSGPVGSEITLASGALLTVNANGTFDYDPNGAFDPTPVPGTGASNTPDSDSFTYTLAGGGTATVSITITGIDTDDDIEGTAGADTLTADGGTDSLFGFGGNDSYYVNSAADLVIEAASEGNDVVYTNVSYALAAGSSVETLSTIALAATDPINLTGNEFGNTLFGNAGANVLIGGGSADFLTGFAGDDQYHVDTAADVVIEQSGEGQDVVYASASYALAMGSSIEVLSTAALGATDAINLTGNELGNVLTGNAGDNVLIGGGGADYMVGFGGDDQYHVDTAGDVVVENAGGGRDVVYASMSYALAAGTSIEVLSTTWLGGTDAINLTGNGLDNLVLGNAGANVLNGGAGADYMAGLAGDDEYHVDNAGDFVAEEAGGGRDAVYASANYTLTAGSAVEVLSTAALGATTAINLTGNELSNEVYGNSGSNVLNGGAGADYLNGFGGADSFAFTTALGGGNVDFVADFTGIGTDGDDVILLDDAVFTGLALGSLDPNAFVVGTAALDADDRIIYDADSGALYFDADGSGAGVAVQFATLDGLPALTAGDFTVI